MQEFFSKYGLAAHLALLAVAPLVLFAIDPADRCGAALLWLSLWASLWMVFEPSRRPGEMLHDSRARILRSVATDPVFWLFAALSAYAAVRWMNGTVELEYDSGKAAWSLAGAFVPWLPSAAKGAGMDAFCGVLATLVVATGCRNALGRQARAVFLSFAVVFGAIAAIAALFASGVPGSAHSELAKAVPGDFRPAGVAFGLLTLAGLVALCFDFEFKWRKVLVPCAVATGACAAALLVFAPVAAASVFLAAALAVLLCSMFSIWFKSGRIDALKYAVFVVAAAMTAGVLCWRVLPAEALAAKFDLAASGFFPDGFWPLRGRLAEIATSIWSKNVWIGSGVDAFQSGVRMAATAGDWAAWGAHPPAGALNGWRQLLAERGVVGAAAFALPLFFMVFTFVRRLVGARGRFTFFPLAVLALFASVAVAVWTFAGAEFASPCVFMPLAAFLALAPFAFPAPRRKDKDDGEES